MQFPTPHGTSSAAAFRLTSQDFRFFSARTGVAMPHASQDRCGLPTRRAASIAKNF
jgi:hypothetical protein